MLNLSEVLLTHAELESFDELVPIIEAAGKAGEIFFRMDLKPPYFDTPDNWEDRLEAAFNTALRE